MISEREKIYRNLIKDIGEIVKNYFEDHPEERK